MLVAQIGFVWKTCFFAQRTHPVAKTEWALWASCVLIVNVYMFYFRKSKPTTKLLVGIFMRWFLHEMTHFLLIPSSWNQWIKQRSLVLPVITQSCKRWQPCRGTGTSRWFQLIPTWINGKIWFHVKMTVTNTPWISILKVWICDSFVCIIGIQKTCVCHSHTLSGSFGNIYSETWS